MTKRISLQSLLDKQARALIERLDTSPVERILRDVPHRSGGRM